MARKNGEKGGRTCKRQRELRESGELRGGRSKRINDEPQFVFLFNTYPYLKYPSRSYVMCDAVNVLLQAELIAHMGRRFGSAGVAEREQVAVLLGGTICVTFVLITSVPEMG